MGTSLSGLTPATTFDGLLKTSDNEPLDGTLKTISDGSGVDSVLELSTTALQIGGATGVYWDNTNKRLGINNTSPAYNLDVNGDVLFTGGSGTYPFDVLPNNGLRLQTSSGGVRQINNFLKFNGTLGIQNLSNTIIGEESTPAARLHIKGSGASAGTTSLLVQNSEGTNVFKVVDDNTMFYHTHKFRSAGGYLYIEVEANVDRSLKIGPTFISTSYGGHIFKTYDGTAYTEVMSITGNTDQFVGIGETTPTARLHIKGSGNDNTTTSLLVQNSDGADLVKVDDAGITNFISKDNSTYYLQAITANTYNGFKFVGGANSREWRTYGGQGTWFSDSLAISTGFQLPTAKLQVKGSGATSATTALLVENSAGTEAFKVEDGGDIVTKGFTFASNTIRPNINGYIGLDRNSNRTFSIVDTNATRTYLNIQSSSTSNFADVSVNTDHLVVKKEGNVAVGTSTLDASAKLQVDSTTQGLLPPRMTTTERDLIATPAAGLMVYNTTTNKAQCYNGTTWNDLF